MNTNYSIVIQWSKADNYFVAMLPEWGKQYLAYGNSYEEALVNARKKIDLLIKLSLSEGKILPEPIFFKIPSVIK
ncbi:MAG: hypothetical protein Tsb0014_18180 [Pleurocapsa sp.]